MLRRIPAYLALAIFSVSCGGNQDDQAPAVEDDADEIEIRCLPLPESTGVGGDDRDLIVVEDEEKHDAAIRHPAAPTEQARRLDYHQLFAQLRQQ